jgi:hypothetical protein
MSEMTRVICPVCCALVDHNGRIIRAPTTELRKCRNGNVSDCIELWRSWMRADTVRYVVGVPTPTSMASSSRTPRRPCSTGESLHTIASKHRELHPAGAERDGALGNNRRQRKFTMLARR